MADNKIRDAIASILAVRPELTVKTLGSMPVPQVGGRLDMPFAGGTLGVEGSYLHDRVAPETEMMLRYKRQF